MSIMVHSRFFLRVVHGIHSKCRMTTKVRKDTSLWWQTVFYRCASDSVKTINVETLISNDSSTDKVKNQEKKLKRKDIDDKTTFSDKKTADVSMKSVVAAKGAENISVKPTAVTNATAGGVSAAPSKDTRAIKPNETEKILALMASNITTASNGNEMEKAVWNGIEALQNKQLNKNNQILNDPVFSTIHSSLDKIPGFNKMSFRFLRKLLQFLLETSEEDSKLTFEILHEGIWRLRNTVFSQSLLLLQTIDGHLTTDKRKELYQIALQTVTRTLGDISNAEELVTAMILLKDYKISHQQLEEQISLLLGTLDPVQLYRVLYFLATTRSKNYMLISETVGQLSTRPINLDLIKLKNLFYACEHLRLSEFVPFLTDVSLNCLECFEKDKKSSPLLKIQILKSCSVLAWNHKSLTLKLLSGINDDLSDNKLIPEVHLASLVNSIGHLNINEYGDFALNISSKVKKLKDTNPSVWLDVVLSLAMLDKASTSMVQEVLQPNFYRPLLEKLKDMPAFLMSVLLTKLLSLQGYSCVTLKDDNLVLPDAEMMLTVLQKQVAQRIRSALVTDVSHALNSLAPLEKYTNRDIVTKYGHIVDFEIFVDKTGKAKRLDESKNHRKVWLKVITPKDTMSGLDNNQRPPTGSTAMEIKHLQALHDTVLFVNHTVWSSMDKKTAHIQYLEKQIRAAVKPATKQELDI